MRFEHRPVYLRRGKAALDARYARHFLYPHFDAVGEGCTFTNPYFVQVVGGGVSLGRYVQVSALLENQVRIAVWPVEPGLGRVRIGDYTVVNPGTRISSGCSIDVGQNAIFASNVYLTDTDWHGRYDRVFSQGGHGPIVIKDNVWLSEGVVVCKGVTIGENSIVGAGSIVVTDVPDNSIAAGNPARVIGQLDPKGPYVSRSAVFADPQGYLREMYRLEDELLGKNTLRGFLRHVFFPRRGD